MLTETRPLVLAERVERDRGLVLRVALDAHREACALAAGGDVDGVHEERRRSAGAARVRLGDERLRVDLARDSGAPLLTKSKPGDERLRERRLVRMPAGAQLVCAVCRRAGFPGGERERPRDGEPDEAYAGSPVADESPSFHML